jgi:hypothetical protein
MNKECSTDTDFYSVDEFLVILFDATRGLYGQYVFNSSLNRVASAGQWLYTIHLNSSNISIPSLVSSDVCYIVVYVHNSYGLSPISNQIRVH